MKHSIVILFLLFSQYSFSQQKQWHQWYYGNKVGLDFRTTGPTMLTNGAMNQMEGSAAVSDDNGDLLFYTDGVTVYNKQHQVMVNGTGLKGSQFSTQSALIVPKPGDKNSYYIFTIPPHELTGGLTYSEVDLRLDGGNGAVTGVKNILLLGDCYEKLAGVKHCNNRDVWVTTYQPASNTFLSYLVTPSGISAMPIVSGTGMQVMPPEQTRGYLRFAPNGRKMAVAFFELGLQLFDFNNQTGELSNTITFNSWSFPVNSLRLYGLEFSPDSRSFYFSSANNQGGGEVLSMDLRNFNRNDILSSIKQVLPWDDYREVFSLCLGPDGRIYMAENMNGTYTSVLTDPDNLAWPGYSTYLFRTGNTTMGLPNIIAGYGRDTVGVINTDPVCNELKIVYSFSGQIPPDSVHWHFGDNGDTTIAPNGIHDYTTAGRYLVSLIRFYPCYSDTIRKEIDVRLPVVRLGNDTALCIRQPLTLKGDITGTAYTWNTGNTSPELSVTQSGLYWLEVTTANNCTTRDSIHVRFKPTPALKALRDTFRCDNIPLLLDVDIQQPGAQYYWQQVLHSSDININQTGTWQVKISLDGCDTATSFKVEQDALPRFSLDNSMKMCFNDKILLDQSQYNYPQYTWQDGSHSSTYTVTQPGKYYLETANRCGTYSDTILVEGEDCEAKFVFPTAFSPNKDGVNDLLRPIFRGNTTDYLLQVYSRWGNLVYKSTNPQQGWDGCMNGTLLPAGSYIWHLQYRSLTTKEMKRNMGSVVMMH